MNLHGNTVLVTGGASGIGLALARRFLDAGNVVIICGGREDKLREAKGIDGRFRTIACDLAQEPERLRLSDWATVNFPALNVLVNNAGIQRRLRLAEQEDWTQTRQELAINLEAPIHLTRLLLPHLTTHARGAVINVTSGLAFAPLARTPIYSATKAALHSFTLSLRHQLRGSAISVIEIVPPAVDTDLGGPGLHTFGVNVDEFADGVFGRLSGNEPEIGYGFAEQARSSSRADLDQMFARINAAQPE
jgi:uncharacterized oxidoreductase